jgi:galactonate dehydratase
MVDICRRLVPMNANRLAKELEPFQPFWLEEPCASENLEALSEIRAQTDIPIVTGEAIYTKDRFREVFEKRAVDIINPDVCSAGGILSMTEIAAMAESYYVAVSPHNYNSTVVGLAATVQAAAVMTNFIIAEYFVPSAKEGRKFARQLEPVNSYIELPESPGLGIEIDEAALSRFKYKQFDQRSLPNYHEELI